MLALVRRAGTLAFAIQFAGAGFTYVQQVLLARLLGAAAFGLYSYVWLGATLVALLSGLGLPAASLRFIPAYLAAGEQGRVRAFRRAAWRLSCGTALLAMLVADVLALVLHAASVLGDPTPLVLGGLLVPALAGSILWSELARARDRVGVAYALPQALRPALIALVAAIAAVAGARSADVAMAATLVAAYLVLVGQRLLTRPLYREAEPISRTPGELSEWLGVGGSLLAVSAFVVVLMQLDVLVVGAIRGSREAGIYAAAAKTATLVSFVLFAVNAIAAPQFASLWAQGRKLELQRLTARLAGMIFWPSLAIALGLAALAGPLLSIFGAGFQSGRSALMVLLVGQLVNAGAGSVGYLLTMSGHHRDAARVLGISAILFVALTALGAATFALTGAAVGSALGFAVWNIWMWALVRRRLGIDASVVGAIK
ncbi:MAG TPA: oligosaccharide flippase family protein [Solirubrobacteraceae bacterium]|nr:oligosaccharide flippase family protein [Solirubrobacteraceae bacterium]